MHQREMGRVLPKMQEIEDARNTGISRKMVKGSQDAFCTKCTGVSVSKFMALVSPWESPLWTWPQLPGAEWQVVSSPPSGHPSPELCGQTSRQVSSDSTYCRGRKHKVLKRERRSSMWAPVFICKTHSPREKRCGWLAGWFPMRGTGWRKQSMVRGSYFRHLSLFPFECVPKPLWILQLKLKTLKFLKN